VTPSQITPDDVRAEPAPRQSEIDLYKAMLIYEQVYRREHPMENDIYVDYLNSRGAQIGQGRLP
jgi:hypothetical protein